MHGRWNMLIVYVTFVLEYLENMWSHFSFPFYRTIFDDNFVLTRTRVPVRMTSVSLICACSLPLSVRTLLQVTDITGTTFDDVQLSRRDGRGNYAHAYCAADNHFVSHTHSGRPTFVRKEVIMNNEDSNMS